jgi:hypothetical protein
MKLLASISLLVLFLVFSVQLSEVRKMYPQASDNEETAKKLFDDLSFVTNREKAVLIAYKGAASTLMTKYTRKVKEKKEFFKTGIEFLEYAVSREPGNIEIRFLRLSVQENAPKFLKYRGHIEEDKKFILDNYGATTTKEVRALIKNYALQSTIFDSAEKQLF